MDRRSGSLEQCLSPRLAFGIAEFRQILTVLLQQVEGKVMEIAAVLEGYLQSGETGPPLLVERHHLAVNQRWAESQSPDRLDDRRETVGPVMAMARKGLCFSPETAISAR